MGLLQHKKQQPNKTNCRQNESKIQTTHLDVDLAARRLPHVECHHRAPPLLAAARQSKLDDVRRHGQARQWVFLLLLLLPFAHLTAALAGGVITANAVGACARPCTRLRRRNAISASSVAAAVVVVAVRCVGVVLPLLACV